MPAVRRDRFAEHGPSVRRSVAELLALRQWTKDAACDGMAWLFDGESTGAARAPDPASPIALARLVTCSRCPVMLECLRDALEPRLGSANVGYQTSADLLECYGTWGGTDRHDRWLVRHLPPDEAERVLLAGFPARLARRVRSWLEALPTRASLSVADAIVAEHLGVTLPWDVRPCTRCRARSAKRSGLCDRCRVAERPCPRCGVRRAFTKRGLCRTCHAERETAA